ncbi:leucine--tRNA ligase [bacterium]|nr:leucine--tRNA ligase [bacterium]
MQYDFINIEKKWQKIWDEKDIFAYEGRESNKPKYYMLEMFPYPSGKLHMGHVRNYSIGDVVARYKKRTGHNVLHPIGWDAFGLPAENAAIENKTAPAAWTYANIEAMRKRFKQLGISYDWKREIATCTPEYYQWEQQFFIEMYDKGMVYRKKAEVNWCNDCNTVLANEQVENGVCWRHGTVVEKRKIVQWYFKITDYAEELLSELDNLTGWPDHVKEMQRNWIGKSTGTYIDFPIDGSDKKVTVFTTRPDTVMGVTFASLAVEHELTDFILEQAENREEIQEFIDEVKELHANTHDDDYEKKGVFTGLYLLHPLNGEKVPLYFANFVLADYGTGVVMAVPAHDQRDFDFAQKYNLPIKAVIKPADKELELPLKEAFTDAGVMFNSGEFDGLTTAKGKKAVTYSVSEKGIGKKGVNFRLRDWGLSRQRYWGTPIPMVYCEKCGIVPVKKEDLPVVLPEDISFSGVTSPLKTLESFYKTTCPTCGGEAKRETDTMDTFVESSWYHIKYCDPHSTDRPFNPDEVNHAMPVDNYIGGVEHAVMHLLYTRYFTKVLADLGYVNFREPVKNLLTQGMVCLESYKMDGGYLYPEEVEQKEGKFLHKESGKEVIVGRKEKMSKSKKNVVDPVTLIEKYGADTARLFVLFAAPPERDLEWSEKGVEGSNRFISRLWNIVVKNSELITTLAAVAEPTEGKELHRKTHETIKKVSEDIEKAHFNTAISAVMELVNDCYRFTPKSDQEKAVLAEALRIAIALINPFVPHITDELRTLCNLDGIESMQPFPLWNEKALTRDEITVVVQINGKLRDRYQVAPTVTREEIESIVREHDYTKYLKSGEIKKVIYVPGKLVNIVG